MNVAIVVVGEWLYKVMPNGETFKTHPNNNKWERVYDPTVVTN